MNKKRIWYYITLIGCAFLYTATILFVMTFITAYQSPAKTVIVPINQVGEANIELVFIAVCFPIAMLVIGKLAVCDLSRLKKEADYIDDPSKFKQKEEDKAFYKTLYGEGKIL